MSDARGPRWALLAALAWLLVLCLGCGAAGRAVGRGLQAASEAGRGSSAGCGVAPPDVQPCAGAEQVCACEGAYRGCRWVWIGCPAAY